MPALIVFLSLASFPPLTALAVQLIWFVQVWMQLVKGQSSAAPDLNFEQAYQDAVLNEVRSVMTEYSKILTKLFSAFV